MAVSTQKLLLEIQVKNQQALGRLNRDVNRLASSQLTLQKAASAAVASIAAIGAVNIAKSIVQTTARFEDLRTSLSSVTGSATLGAKAFNDIVKFSTKTQFGVEDLSRSFIKLKAAGIEPSEELLTLFTDTAAITTDQIGTLEAVTDLFARTVSGGLGLEEIERLGDRGVPVLRIIEEQLGLTRSQISEYGKTAEGARRITDAFARGIRQQYGGATANVVNNLSTQFSNFSIAIKIAADQFGQALAPEIKKATKELTAFIEENTDKFPQIARDIAEVSKSAIGLGKDVAAAFRDLYDLADDLGVKEVGIIGFLLLGTKGKIAVLAFASITAALKKFNKALKEAGDASAFASDGIVSADDEFNMIGATMPTVQENAHNLATEFYDFEGTTTGMNNAIKETGFALSGNIGLYDDMATETQILANRTKEAARELKEFKDQIAKTFTGEVLQGLTNYGTELKKLAENYKTTTLVTNTLTAATKAFENTTVRALTDVILGAQTLQEALGQVGQAILRELIGGIIRFLIVGPAIRKLAEIFGIDFVDAVAKQVDAQKRLNNELKKTVGLRLLLLLIGGAADGGKVGFANGGKVEARAGGGPVGSRTPYIVGERGPELFVPEGAGTIIPNERMNTMGAMGANVTFNINANDAAGFDQLLVQRRGLITNMISDALQRQGRRFA